jgi:2-oxoglutarate ferredoxin oxidoreductase subunit beta
MDRDPKHLNQMLLRAGKHKGTSMLEIYQNCIVFNDGAFELFTDKKSRPNEAIYLENGQPLVYGSDEEKGIRLDGHKPEIVSLEDGSYSKDDLWIHDEEDLTKAHLLSRFFDQPKDGDHHFPRPFGVLYAVDRTCYDDGVNAQVEDVVLRKGVGDLDELIRGPETWTVD